MRPACTLVLCSVLALALAAPATADARRPSGAAVAHYVNKQRAKYGLPPLRRSRSLWRSSRRYAVRMMSRNFFGHSSRIAAPRRFRRLAETLALHRGWRLRARRVVRQWMRSPSHRAALLSPTYRWIGVGRSRGRMGRMKATVWVVHLGRR